MKHTMLRKLITLSVIFYFSAACPAEHNKPNIILLIGDDHGAPYFGFMGDENVVTPNMDMLAESGMTFTQGYATANHCRPSLRTLITGLHPVQYKMRLMDIMERKDAEDSAVSMMDNKTKRMWLQVEEAASLKEFETLPKLLGEQGYVSWQGGKWWENSYKNGYFDEGMTKGWNMDLFDKDEFFFENMGAEGVELGRKTMEPVLDFISRNKEKPFFVWYGPALPHTPFNAEYKHKKYYDERPFSDSAKMYYSNITWWDDGVGQLLDHVEHEGILDDTLFIYINDNGWEQEPKVEYKQEGSTWENDVDFANGGPKGKLGLYDQSFRTPVIFYWRNHIQGSFDTNSLVSMEDIVPTILDIAGVSKLKTPSDLPGYSLKPLLEGDAIDQRDAIVGYAHQRRSEQDMMGQRAEGYYVRTERWFFRWYKDIDKMELFDVRVDPTSENNVIEAFPHLIEGFVQMVDDWKTSVGMDTPIPVS